jgi:hypothetical protein
MTWQPIETAPRDGTRILVWPAWGATTQGSRAEIVLWTERPRGGFRWEMWSGHKIPCDPTHWMPLPASPGDGDGR